MALSFYDSTTSWVVRFIFVLIGKILTIQHYSDYQNCFFLFEKIYLIPSFWHLRTAYRVHIICSLQAHVPVYFSVMVFTCNIIARVLELWAYNVLRGGGAQTENIYLLSACWFWQNNFQLFHEKIRAENYLKIRPCKKSRLNK